jgi:hypothetical protein
MQRLPCSLASGPRQNTIDRCYHCLDWYGSLSQGNRCMHQIIPIKTVVASVNCVLAGARSKGGKAGCEGKKRKRVSMISLICGMVDILLFAQHLRPVNNFHGRVIM